MIQQTHDYTDRYWGHDYVITKVIEDGWHLKMMGWGRGINPGDYILIKSQSSDPLANPDTRYRVTWIEYFNDPKDMWKMDCWFAPRQTRCQLMQLMATEHNAYPKGRWL